MTTRLLPVLAAVGALALSGCSGADDAAAPDGSSDPAATSTPAEAAVETIDAVEPAADATDLAAPGLVLSVPAAWETGEQSTEGLTQLMARGEQEDGSRAAVNVVAVPTSETDLTAAVDETRSLGEVRSETPVSLPNVSTDGPATLLDLDYAVEGRPTQTWVLVFELDGSTYTVTFLSEPFDEALAREILGTLRDA